MTFGNLMQEYGGGGKFAGFLEVKTKKQTNEQQTKKPLTKTNEVACKTQRIRKTKINIRWRLCYVLYYVHDENGVYRQSVDGSKWYIALGLHRVIISIPGIHYNFLPS